METLALQIRMLGGFSLTLGEKRVEDEKGRSKKVWLLLAYLLYNHHRVVTQTELIDLFWNDEKEGANPVNALKTTLHRARAVLDGLTPELGHKLILRKGGGYACSDEITLWLDTAEFESLCRQRAEEADGGISRLEKAMGLYGGEFMGKFSSESWTMPVAAYFQSLYMDALRQLLPLMDRAGEREKIVLLCRKALQTDPYQEDIYQDLMRALLNLERQQQAVEVYEEMSKLLLTNLGVMPDQESRVLYREALRTVNHHVIPSGELYEHLREMGPVKGALLCDFDFFRMIYQAEARMVIRSGDAVHVVLFTLSGQGGSELPRRSLERAMENFQEQVRTNLRKGDVVSRCSPSQLIVMLPQANYENSCMVSQRILRAFSRQFPHSPARIDFTVLPLEPVPAGLEERSGPPSFEKGKRML